MLFAICYVLPTVKIETNNRNDLIYLIFQMLNIAKSDCYNVFILLKIITEYKIDCLIKNVLPFIVLSINTKFTYFNLTAHKRKFANITGKMCTICRKRSTF